MRLLFTFLRAYPTQSAVTLGALLLAGLIEGFGFSLLVPLIGIVFSANGAAVSEGALGADSTLEQMVNQVFGALGLTPSIGLLLIIFVVTMTVKAFIMLAANKRVGYMVAQVTTDLRLELLHALFVTRWEYFIRQPVGSLTNSMATEASRAAKAYLHGIKILVAAMQAMIYSTIALLVSWQATLVAFIGGFLILALFRRYIKKAKKAGERQTKLLQSLLSIMTESLVMIKPLKTMAREHFVDAVLKKKAEGLKKTIKKMVFAATALAAFQEPVTVAFAAIGLYGILVIWKLPLANVLIMVYMFQKLMKRLQKIQTLYQLLVNTESAYWSLQDKVVAAKQTQERTLGTQKASLKRDVRLDGVSFSYGKDERWILKEADIDFPEGSFTAIVGPSGIGKTTIADLITGLLRPQKGEIWIDDVPLADIDIRDWRKRIGYVPQETLLLNDSIFVNVTLGDKELSEKDVEDALRAAGAWQFVQALPDGIKTMVGESGYRFSGGQRQRISIARAIVHRPKLLILDEATTALDPENEAAVCEILSQLRNDLTILAISHQPAILSVADRAFRLEGGKAILEWDRLTERIREPGASASFV
ncbi:MAG: ABC transporter ATP-binding protein [Deltaproteobacteria bacterium]|jgi:ATP-binding cassette subfamily C protein|nr:ABC transporter ATP-binding protein [Deltaproteobacteria bacterium]